MKISCPNCAAAYELDDSRVPPAGLSIKCPKCKNPFTVHKPKLGEGKASGPIPLPGQPGPRPAAKAARPAALRAKTPVAPPPGPVPLPGVDDVGQTQESPRPFDAGEAAQAPGFDEPPPQPGFDDPGPGQTLDDGRVPLPGQDAAGAVPLPGHDAGDALPLPGQDAGDAAPGLGQDAGDAVPLPGQDAGDAVPLPGLDGDSDGHTAVDARPAPSVPPPLGFPDFGDAVPLPGLDDPLPPPVRPASARPPRQAPKAAPRQSAPPPVEDDDPFASINIDEPGDTMVDQKPLAGDQDLSFPAAPPPPPPESAPPPAQDVASDDPFAVDFPEPTPAPAPAPARPPPAVLPDDGGLNFDSVETGLVPKPPPKAPGSDMLDFVDDEPKRVEKKPGPKKPPPPQVSQSSTSTTPSTAPKARDEEKAAGGDAGDLALDEPGAEAPTDDAGDLKKAEKARKKLQREERVARDREARARRKALAGPGVLQTRILPALREAAASLRTPRNAGFAALAVLAVVVAIFGFRARRTPAGFFWVNTFVPSKKAATAAEAKVIEHGLERLGAGDFAGAREAAGSAAQLIAVLPDDEDVKAYFVLSASELKLSYGQVGGDWDQAKRVVEKMKATRPAQARARGAFALASGDVPKAKTILAPLGDAATADLESVWLYAESLILGNESAKAAQVLDNALKTRGTSPKLLIARGLVARQKLQLPEANGFFERALKSSPENGRALVELADVRLRQGDIKGAGELLAHALDTEVRKSLDAVEEARANMLRGRLAAASHNAHDAEIAYERAVGLDPQSAEIREAYGEFRLNRREWEKAAKQYDAAIATGNASPAASASAARAYLGTNRLLEADKRINEAVAKEGGNAHYIYLQGRVAEAIGKGDEAFRRYEAALQKKPDLVEALAAEGMVYVNRGEKQKAQEKLEAALKVPDASRSSQEDEAVGDLALLLDRKDQAKESYARALLKDPEDPLAHSGLGKALAALGDLPQARKEMETALSQVDTDPAMHFEYGSLLRRMGEPEAALAALRRAVKLDSKDPRFRSRLGALLVERGQFEEAEQQLRQAVLMNDKYGEGQFFLARALAGRKNLPEAVDAMKRAVDIEPDNAEYLLHLGLIYEAGQQVQDAVDAFQRSIDKDPKSADAFEHLGLNLMVENRFAEAVAAFKKAAELDPKRARLWAEVGDAEQQSGDVDGAIRDFQKALSQDASLTGTWTRLGIAYKDKDCTGCRAKALDALKRATRVDPADAIAHHQLGYMYKDDRKRAEAIAEFKRYLELRPDAGDLSSVQDDIFYLQEETRRAP